MNPRNRVTPMVASGTTSVVKLLVATLAFTGAYLGVESTYGASERSERAPAAQISAARAPVHTVALSSESTPAEQVAVEQAAEQVVAGRAAQVPAKGVVTVSELTVSGSCDRPYRIQSVVGDADPKAAVSYDWRLERWSPASRAWRTYLTASSGFTGGSQTVEWQPRIVDNPGWYRAVLTVSGERDPLRSEKFRVTC
ncbi:hypothetical protein FHS43_002402 [Streptosporangium becharense]|uniref:Uncharacterized protein n=1 Tax=Streptosporangium becharense TaxID=1816182 RepID=A0A7W9IJE8_9ACTN|nr:hypothetical protein [Streptosporangium becharense]MBB2911137.1 hypothetical protein [Streptosporangium becharense]MBB5821805.1 hypothetical protein [Streptosporangium becharense]